MSATPDRRPGRADVADVEIEGRALRLSNLDKVLWPATGFTKGDMLDYYGRVAPALLPHLADRPLTLRRFPDGVGGLEWYQSECRGRPSWLPVHPIVARTGQVFHYCLVNDLASLLWVVNLATIELHPFLATATPPAQPTVVVFDLDPGPPAGLLECCAVALRIRTILGEDHGLDAWPKTSGSLGLHVYAPLRRPTGYEETKALARAVARRLVAEQPDRVVDRMLRAVRAGRVFVDWSQNDPMKSTVAAYSLRATSRPAVSTPLQWTEVEQAVARADAGALGAGPDEVLRRVERHGDLFRPVLGASARSVGA